MAASVRGRFILPGHWQEVTRMNISWHQQLMQSVPRDGMLEALPSNNKT